MHCLFSPRPYSNLLDQFPDPYKRYITARDIRFIHIPVAGNKESSNDMDAKKVESMLRIICGKCLHFNLLSLSALILMVTDLPACTDVSFHPIMIHCRSGKHRTGCIIGCLRMVRLNQVNINLSEALSISFLCAQLQGWPAQDICDEYTEYASHKGREFDKQVGKHPNYVLYFE